MAKDRESERVEVVDFVAHTGGPVQAGVFRICDPTMVCSHYHYSGHDVSTCFQLYGFPDGWLERTRTRSCGRSRGTSSAIGSSREGGTSVRLNTAQVSSPLATVFADIDCSTLLGFNDKQWSILLNLMKFQSSGSTNRFSSMASLLTILLDSGTGASHHMTGTLDLLMWLT